MSLPRQTFEEDSNPIKTLTLERIEIEFEGGEEKFLISFGSLVAVSSIAPISSSALVFNQLLNANTGATNTNAPSTVLQASVNLRQLTAHTDEKNNTLFNEVKFLKNKWNISPQRLPKKILVLDLDETLIMSHENLAMFTSENRDNRNIFFIEEDSLIELMEDISEEDMMIVILTKRCLSQNAEKFFSAMSILEELERRCDNISIFASIFYSNKCTKVPALNYLYETYLKPQGIGKESLAFADDLTINLNEANEAGYFNTMQADSYGTHYETIFEFVFDFPEIESMCEENNSDQEDAQLVHSAPSSMRP